MLHGPRLQVVLGVVAEIVGVVADPILGRGVPLLGDDGLQVARQGTIPMSTPVKSQELTPTRTLIAGFEEYGG